MMERGNLCEISQVAVDSPFAVVCFLLDFGEGLAFEIQIHDLCLMRSAGAHIVFRPARHNEISFLFQLTNVTFDCRRTYAHNDRRAL